MAKTRRRKKRTHIPEASDPSKKGDPKSFVFRRGRHGAILKDLEKDLRKVMAPNTATALKESKRNVLKDFVHVAGPLGVTHFMILTASHNASYLRVAKTPRGPTLTMRIHEYALIRDVIASQQRPRAPQTMWLAPPLVVMNNFTSGGAGEEHLKLATSMFQNLFPAINVQTTKLSSCQRVLLLEYSRETGRISLRHYSVGVAPSGVTRNLKALLSRRSVPDMGGMRDVAEFMTKSGYGSESEGEEAEASRVTLAQDLGRGNVASRQSRVRLSEIGPRMELEIIKVEEGLAGGRVLYHKYEQRAPEEAAAQQAAVDSAAALRAQRKSEQASNVQRKAEERAARGDGKRERQGEEGGGAGPRRGKRQRQWWERNDAGNAPSDDDDAEEYRREVGEEPDDAFRLTAGSGGRGGGGGRGRFGGGRGGGRGRGGGGRGGGGRGRDGGSRFGGGGRGRH